MTFTSIPPSLKPVVEDVARAICYARSMPACKCKEHAGRCTVPWEYMSSEHTDKAETAILAFLNACVERGVGWRIAEYMPLEPDMPFENPAFVLNLGATDDTA